MTRIVFLDTETSGLDPRRHEIWELFWQEYELQEFDEGWKMEYITQYHYQLEINLNQADLIALNIGGYFKPNRLKKGGNTCLIEGNSAQLVNRGEIARRIQSRWHDAMLVGANPAFDQSFLVPFLYKHGNLPTWQYHLCDIRALVSGYLAGSWLSGCAHPPSTYLPPWRGKRDQVAEWLEIDLTDPAYKEHTAEGDTILVVTQFKKVYNLQ